jgi:hypothetical protein
MVVFVETALRSKPAKDIFPRISRRYHNNPHTVLAIFAEKETTVAESRSVVRLDGHKLVTDFLWKTLPQMNEIRFVHQSFMLH